MAPVQAWEYHFQEFAMSMDRRAESLLAMNELGEVGWEIAGLVGDHPEGKVDVIFKRRARD